MVEKIDCNGSQNLICTKKKLEIGNEIWKIRNPETNSESRKLGNPETNSENGKLRNPETNSEETNSEIDRISKNVRKIWFIAQAWNDWVGKKKGLERIRFLEMIKMFTLRLKKGNGKRLIWQKSYSLGGFEFGTGQWDPGCKCFWKWAQSGALR